MLSILLDKLGFEWGKSLVHFSYGMVELPEGKMKSREGTVVDADDLMEEMIATAKETSQELGKLDGLTQEEADVYKRQAVAATMANTEADAPTNVAPVTCELNKGNTL